MTKPNQSLLIVLLAIAFFSFSTGANAQLVFDRADIDGSFAQSSILDAGSTSYGLQPLPITTSLAIATADSIKYHTAFTAAPVELPHSNCSASVGTGVSK